jgi:hypothetical protein
MSLLSLINIIGLCINTAGSFLIFVNSLKVNHMLIAYEWDELKKLNKIAGKKNSTAGIGAFLLVIGFLLQITAAIFNS